MKKIKSSTDIFSLLDGFSHSGIKLSEEEIYLQLFLFKTFWIKNDSTEEIIKKNPKLHGFLLPMLFNFLEDRKASGILKISLGNGDVFKIHYKKGYLDSVRGGKDSATFLGSILLSMEILTSEELTLALSESAAKDVPLGRYLHQEGKLSDADRHKALQRQCAVRLSQTLSDEKAQLAWISVMEEDTQVDEKDSVLFTELYIYMTDWLNSKISSEWLRQFFVNHSSCRMIPGDNFSKLSEFLGSEIADTSLVEEFQSGLSLGEIFDKYLESEETLQKVLYFLITFRVLCFDSESDFYSKQKERKVARKVLKETRILLQNKNYFEVLQIDFNVRDEQVRLAYEKRLHKYSDESYKSHPKLLNSVLGYYDRAFRGLQTESKRKLYLSKLDLNPWKWNKDMERQVRRVKMLIRTDQLEKARNTIKNLLSKKIRHPKVLIYHSWIQLQMDTSASQADKVFKSYLSYVPLEEQQDSEYFFVKGLYFRNKENNVRAESFFKNALALNTVMGEARFELKKLRFQIQSQKAKKKKRRRWLTTGIMVASAAFIVFLIREQGSISLQKISKSNSRSIASNQQSFSLLGLQSDWIPSSLLKYREEGRFFSMIYARKFKDIFAIGRSQVSIEPDKLFEKMFEELGLKKDGYFKKSKLYEHTRLDRFLKDLQSWEGKSRTSGFKFYVIYGQGRSQSHYVFFLKTKSQEALEDFTGILQSLRITTQKKL